MKHLVFAVFTLLLLIPTALAQENAEPIEPKDAEMVNPEAHISWPPPVYVVRDNVDIRGTVTLAAMRNFFIEFRPLMLGMMDDDEEVNPWLPGTLPRIEAVADDILGSWNTVTLRDGLYELRLTVNTGGAEPEHYRVSPIRVDNAAPPFMAEEQVTAVDEPEAPAEDQAPEPVVEPASEPEPAPTEDPRPHVVATVNSNVRAGDSTLYAVIGHLLEGDSALIKGVSSYGTGWYYIELANGRSGFIYPHIVTTRGDLGNLPRINPPPLPPTPIPVPTAVPAPQQPQTGADLVFHSVRVDPHPADCNETYRIDVTVRNAGSGAATSGGNILVSDRGVNGTAQAQTTNIAFGPLAPGHTQEVFGHLTPTLHYDTIHHISLQLDSNNQVAETNEGNNFHADAPYYMARGSC
ncbi:MAG: hypothetical protein OXI30_18740 [Chloroflexota bacterium]|nr:hypothetical protein [Chloroflexota bacterium]